MDQTSKESEMAILARRFRGGPDGPRSARPPDSRNAQKEGPKDNRENMTVDERPNVEHPGEGPLESDTGEGRSSITPATGTAAHANVPSSQRTSSGKKPSGSRGTTPKPSSSGRAGPSKQGSASKTMSPSNTKRRGVTWDEIKTKRTRRNMKKGTVLIRKPVCLR